MQTAASRRLRTSASSVLACYFVVFLGINYLVFRDHPTGPLLWFFAALPTVPMVAVFMLLARYLRDERDGFKRELVIRCLLWGLAGSMSLHLFESFLRIFQWNGHFLPFTELYVFVGCMLAAKLSYRVANRVPADA